MVERGKPKGGKRPPKPPVNPHAGRDRFAFAVSILTLLCLAAAFVNTNGPQFLSPGPLISAHSTIGDCGACHTQSKPDKFGWVQRIMHDERTQDVQACVTCHKVKGDVRFAHTARKWELDIAKERHLKISNQIPKPLSAKLRSVMFPQLHLRIGNLQCSSCHQEHQGKDFNLEAISNDQCQACHAVQFDSFDGNHPTFDDYPFKRRTRLIYDHARHFGKHFLETKERNPQANAPSTCSICHTSQKDRRHMTLTSFDETCASCHLDQIFGKGRVSGPKGIAFLTLPGIDVVTLRDKNAPIGEWPELSEAEVTPFMKVLLSRNQESSKLLEKIGKLDLRDLTQATDQEIETATKFIWEIKGLFYALVSGTASDVMVNIGAWQEGSGNQKLISDLTASLPRDVIVAAQREWLPNLGREMASRGDAAGTGWTSSASESRLSGAVAPDDLPPFRPFDKAGAAGNELPDLQRLAQASTPAEGWQAHIIGADVPPAANAAATDPTVDAVPEAAPSEVASTSAVAPIESTVNAEAWAEYGGWYRQEFAILYRPVGHKDQFIRSWLDLTGPYALKSGTTPPALIFDVLATKGAQGECVKCHSVDSIQGYGRKVNWSPASPETKRGRFTTFVHEPHFGVMENKGCLTCHKLRQGVPYSKTFAQGNPQSFVSGFSQVDKQLCQTCHTQGVSRQDCLLCHKYHINGIITPMIETQLPQQ